MSEAPTPKAAAPDEVAIEGRKARLRWGDLVYTLRGVSLAILSFIRVPVEVERAGQAHLDRVDLSSARARRRFSESAARKLGLEAPRVEAHLVAIIEILEEREREELEKTERLVFPKPPALTDDERRQALAYLARPDLLEAIEADLGRLGYVGESGPKKIAYLISVSRKLPAPLAGILRSWPPNPAGRAASWPPPPASGSPRVW